MHNWREKLRASGIHLGISLAISGIIAWLVFRLWYPCPYLELSGGRELFLLVMAVDVVIGPLITLIILNKTKSRRELLLDFAVIGLLQLAALGYGLWTLFAARPVHLVFEYHRIAVVHDADIDPLTLQKAPPSLQALPITGPTLLSLRKFTNHSEQLESTMIALNGVPQAAQPALWQPWNAAHADILNESRPATQLLQRFEAQTEKIQAVISETGRVADELRYLPLIGRKASWTVLIDGKSAEPVGFISLDSF